MSDPKIDFKLLYSAAQDVQKDIKDGKKSLEKLEIEKERFDNLINSLEKAVNGNTRSFYLSFSKNPGMYITAQLILSESDTYSAANDVVDTMNALYKKASETTWAKQFDSFKGTEAYTGKKAVTPDVPVLTPADIDFSNSLKVISGASKFVIPIGELPGAVPLVYPAGHEKAGQPIVDWEENPIGKKGIVFYNFKDNTYQAAAAGKDHVIIFNQVTPKQAYKMYEIVDELTGGDMNRILRYDRLDRALIIKGLTGDPLNLTHGQLIQVFEKAKQIGLIDRYNSSTDYIQKNMVKAQSDDTWGSVEKSFGFMNRNRDLAEAVYISGPFVFKGTGGAEQKMQKGGVVVRMGDRIDAIQPDIFNETYSLPNGKPVTRTLLKEATPIEFIPTVKTITKFRTEFSEDTGVKRSANVNVDMVNVLIVIENAQIKILMDLSGPGGTEYPFGSDFKPPVVMVDGKEIKLKEKYNRGAPSEYPGGGYYEYLFSGEIDTGKSHEITVIDHTKGQKQVVEYKPQSVGKGIGVIIPVAPESKDAVDKNIKKLEKLDTKLISYYKKQLNNDPEKFLQDFFKEQKRRRITKNEINDNFLDATKTSAMLVSLSTHLDMTVEETRLFISEAYKKISSLNKGTGKDKAKVEESKKTGHNGKTPLKGK